MNLQTRALWVAALAFCAPAIGQEAPEPPTTTGQVTAGVQGIDDPEESSKFEEYRDVPNGPFLGSFDFGVQGPSWNFDLRTVRPGRQDQQIDAVWRKPGILRIRASYDQTPKWFSNTAATLFTPRGGSLILPDPMQEDLEAIGTPAGPQLVRYLEAAHPTDLRYRRDSASADLVWNATPRLSTRVAMSQEKRHGNRPVSVATYFSAGDITEFPAPLDSSTALASAAVEYVRPAWNLGAEVQVSQFDNNVEAFARGAAYGNAWAVDNPLRLTDADAASALPNAAGAVFLISAPPDNTAGWVNVNGGLRVGSWGNLTAQVSMGRNEQNEAFLPFSLNTAVAPPPEGLAILAGGGDTSAQILLGGSPQTRYDGRVDIGLYHLRFTGRATDRLRFDVFARSYDYDNRTPHYVVTDYIRADTGLEGIARGALPFAWKKDNVGVEAKFKAGGRVGVTLGAERESWDRKFRSAPQTDEDIFKIALDYRAGTSSLYRLSWKTSERTHDNYDIEHWVEESYPEGEPVAGAEFLLHRQFDMANRDQDRVDLLAQFMLGDRVGLGLDLNSTRSDYEAPFGRTEDRSIGGALDLSYMINDTWSVSADAGMDRWEHDINSRYRPVVANVAVDDPLNDWFTSIEDTTFSYGAGIEAILVPDRWRLEARGTRVDSEGTFDNRFVPGGAAQGEAPPWPQVEYALTSVSADLFYTLGDHATLGLGYLFEAYDQDDWARDPMQTWMGAQDPGAAESVFLGWRIPDYDVHLVRLLLQYRF